MALKLIKNNDPIAQPFSQLQQLYEFEFSLVTGYKTNKEGFYEQQELIAHWGNQFDIYILYNDERPIGFSVVNLCSMITGEEDIRDIAEFFIMPDSRNNGTGKWLAHEIFKIYPGSWEVRQLPGLKVRDFWVKTIAEFSSNNYCDLEIKNEKWEGYLQQFISSPLR